jgi:hypothetical protein
MKGPGQNFVTCEGRQQQLEGHYDAVASFKLPYGSWDGIYQFTPGRTLYFILIPKPFLSFSLSF